jgi:hypothetical protein
MNDRRRAMGSFVRLGGIGGEAMSHEVAVKKLDEDLRAFYLSKEYDESLFESWERGEARGDSTTPSVCSPAYRTWMLGELRTALSQADGGSLLSLGAGNAFIERILVDEGYDVLAVDFLQSAVDVALRATVPAIREDIRTWDPGSAWDVVYADGLLGHLYGGQGGCTEVLARMRSWLTKPGSLVVSNDAPPNGAAAAPAPGVNGFNWLSIPLLVREMEEAGFDTVDAADFWYERPISGPRRRAIVTGRVAA